MGLGLITGTITYGGQPAFGAEVRTNTGGCALALSGGHYLMNNPAGICTVVAIYNNKRGYKNNVRVIAGDVTEVNIDITP